jgi:hypothetical protein
MKTTARGVIRVKCPAAVTSPSGIFGLLVAAILAPFVIFTGTTCGEHGTDIPERPARRRTPLSFSLPLHD